MLLLLVGVIYLAYNRERVFIRNPLGSLTRDGVKEEGAQVFINYSNDVLIENDRAPMYTTLVQRNRPIGTPANLKCVHYVVCMTDADSAGMSAVDEKAVIESMSGKEVRFRDHEGRDVVVGLR
jgi:hypothetical protein